MIPAQIWSWVVNKVLYHQLDKCNEYNFSCIYEMLHTCAGRSASLLHSVFVSYYAALKLKLKLKLVMLILN